MKFREFATLGRADELLAQLGTDEEVIVWVSVHGEYAVYPDDENSQFATGTFESLTSRLSNRVVLRYVGRGDSVYYIFSKRGVSIKKIEKVEVNFYNRLVAK